MAANGCSGGMDTFARWINKYIRRAGDDRALAFTGCCDEHDLFYEQGVMWPGKTWKDWPGFRPLLSWLWGRVKDVPWRWRADRLLRECVAANLKARGRSKWVRLHVPWCVWVGVRVLGWWNWGTV